MFCIGFRARCRQLITCYRLRAPDGDRQLQQGSILGLGISGWGSVDAYACLKGGCSAVHRGLL